MPGVVLYVHPLTPQFFFAVNALPDDVTSQKCTWLPYFLMKLHIFFLKTNKIPNCSSTWKLSIFMNSYHCTLIFYNKPVSEFFSHCHHLHAGRRGWSFWLRCTPPPPPPGILIFFSIHFFFHWAMLLSACHRHKSPIILFLSESKAFSLFSLPSWINIQHIHTENLRPWRTTSKLHLQKRSYKCTKIATKFMKPFAQ